MIQFWETTEKMMKLLIDPNADPRLQVLRGTAEEAPQQMAMVESQKEEALSVEDKTCEPCESGLWVAVMGFHKMW